MTLGWAKQGWQDLKQLNTKSIFDHYLCTGFQVCFHYISSSTCRCSRLNLSPKVFSTEEICSIAISKLSSRETKRMTEEAHRLLVPPKVTERSATHQDDLWTGLDGLKAYKSVPLRDYRWCLIFWHCRIRPDIIMGVVYPNTTCLFSYYSLQGIN